MLLPMLPWHCLSALQFASHWHFNLFPPFLRLMQSTYPPSLPPRPTLYRLQKCLIGSGHNFSIRINYVRRQRKMAASATGRRCRQMRFSKFTPSPVSTSTQPEALTGLAIITPIITAIFYALPGWWRRGGIKKRQKMGKYANLIYGCIATSKIEWELVSLTLLSHRTPPRANKCNK